MTETMAEMRRKQHMSQADLAKTLGRSQQTVAKWECGKAEPSIAMILSMAQIFGCSLEELVLAIAEQKNDKENPA